MKILVTGGAGFIGSNTVSRLLEEGHKVTIVDNLSTGHTELLNQKAEFIKGDLADTELLKKITKSHDAVIHFAGLIIVPESVQKPRLYFDNNLSYGINLLEAMRLNDVKKIVFSSSAAVYGNPVRIPIEEDDLKKPITPYGASKLAFEDFLACYGECYGINHISLRYFNAYGPGELHNPETHAIPNFIKNALKKKPVVVYGDGGQTRDFVYIEDLTKAHTAALKSKSGYYNIGAGTGITVNKLIEKIFKITGAVQIRYTAPREGDPLQLVADITKAKRFLSWEPSVSLDSGLLKTVDFFRK